MASRLTLFRLSPFISLGSCNHCNLAHFLRSNNFGHPSQNYYGLCFFNSKSHRLSLAEIFIFSLILSPGTINFHLFFQISKAANLFETSTRNCSLPPTSLTS
jgi:hypothetical protein